MTQVAIVSLGRHQAKGELRRVASWRLLFEHAGAQVDEVRVAPGWCPHFDGVIPVARGQAPPERVAWSGIRLREQLAVLDPAVVIVVSTRAYDPLVSTSGRTVVLDFVDSLSRSYRDRSEVVPGLLHRQGYRTLAATHRRVEERLRAAPVRRVAAGWADARRLDAEWVPIVSDPTLHARAGQEPDRDVLFFGTLRYPPNIDALERLGRLWPDVLRKRPATTALIAGSAPPDRVRDLCATHRWELLADFDSLPAVVARARIAVAPLERTAGIQIKILDAACLGIPQVVTPAALEGFAPGIRLAAQLDDHAFAAEIVRLLDDPRSATAEAATLRDRVDDEYGVERWAAWARDALETRTK